MSKMEDWNIGDTGVIVSNEHSHSKFSIGDIVIITSIENDFVWCKNGEDETGCADLRDIERVETVGESKNKFRICDILGVDVGQEFEVNYEGRKYIVLIGENGIPFTKNKCYINTSSLVIYAINHPKSITIYPNREDIEYAKKIYEVFGRDGTIRRVCNTISTSCREPSTILEFDGVTIKDIGFNNLKVGESVKLSDLIDIS